jgi:hypothetical protein
MHARTLKPDKVSVSAMKYFLFAPHCGHRNFSIISNGVPGATAYLA